MYDGIGQELARANYELCQTQPGMPTVSERISAEIKVLTKRLDDLHKAQELLAKSEIKEIVDLLSSLNIRY